MIYRIAIYGSAADTTSHAEEKAKLLGECLAQYDCEIITGACPGLPHIAAEAAHAGGKTVWGFSPATNLEQQLSYTPEDEINIYHKLDYVPESFPFASNFNACKKYRNVTSTATTDAGIIISGRWGSMHEFCSLYDMGKVIGVLLGSGGIADELPALLDKINKPSSATVIFNADPKELVRQVYQALQT